ncbi:MAG: SDR family oxidoreductase [Gammaproteobacteria bacterium]|uniref:SDR family NAD(P)-dependent oxidoreductase n=1 Tax=Limnobacter sp. TaxID=2003368 RepID=UPI001D2DBE76|nr:SDR family oxidoreductase [Limnobacter sp.]MBU0785027.1 SDR family oxidoreductase [Gammaproteobacteria bacterium]MBU0849065.1 SDR family oxidoreductase [Gammaproteobacteria bacterium]MBU1266642.1 SDR family oxidoreductase [Gammaproteobacteria bacterium]MBU1529891.1 SDR family oxidoreductase [Gammaproteobacteria bacterium]MBU1781402.1 SDR family oxidoreductase [Gammaproteobacteria bacterium]
MMNTRDLFSMQGKLALVTGASSGLGKHFALVLAQAGATVLLSARNVEKLQQVLGQIQAEGGTAFAVAMDVSKSSSVNAAMAQIVQQYGVPDVLVNNAGQSIAKPMLEQTEEDWDQILDTNLKGCWLVATELARALAAAGKPGSIVNIASILGERVGGAVGPYAISKAGLVQATKAMALELARYNIRVNAILPGYVATDMNSEFLAGELGDKLRKRIPTRQFCELSDLTGPLLLLASNAGAGMTGACVAVDRGHLVSAL